MTTIRVWLDGIKPGFGSKYGDVFETLGADDTSDLVADAEFFALLGAAIPFLPMKKIRGAIEALSGSGADPAAAAVAAASTPTTTAARALPPTPGGRPGGKTLPTPPSSGAGKATTTIPPPGVRSRAPPSPGPPTSLLPTTPAVAVPRTGCRRRSLPTPGVRTLPSPGGGTNPHAASSPKPSVASDAEVRSNGADGPLVPPALAVIPDGKHAFLSYQWDVQAQVVQIKELLNERGVTCWMDIDGGMKSNIYDSVSNTSFLFPTQNFI